MEHRNEPIIISARKIVAKMLKKEKRGIAKRKLKMLVILIGNNEISKLYIKKKKELCENFGVECRLAVFKTTVKEKYLIEKIKKLIQNYDGAIVQLPIPSPFDTEMILRLIPPEKDIDALSSSKFLSPTVRAITYILKKYKIPLKNIAIIGNGRLVGRPLSAWFAKNKVSFKMMDEKIDIVNLKMADVVISAVGKPVVKSNMIKRGAVLIDIGNHYVNKKVMGDMDKSCYKKASIVAPVPGGIGMLTIFFLIKNLFEAKRYANAKFLKSYKKG